MRSKAGLQQLRKPALRCFGGSPGTPCTEILARLQMRFGRSRGLIIVRARDVLMIPLMLTKGKSEQVLFFEVSPYDYNVHIGAARCRAR
jgi:hypothetical protein